MHSLYICSIEHRILMKTFMKGSKFTYRADLMKKFCCHETRTYPASNDSSRERSRQLPPRSSGKVEISVEIVHHS